ncbi:ENTH domain-containing protein C794.11c [Manihot esculenta]|uniref:ENTH domain-containing protein n=1 Tax=Manihot esculenta TaxID=3983 RepID=A0A2C9V2X1_MANES|nr:ENTH domain-containing protein C794.11c [Manihot esculenta]OAY38632.1 hypothetical protein MANES_10G030500v8 [Manihot esculenta]
MSMLLDRNNKMGSPSFHELKRQASFFFKEKIKTARLALTDVTAAELLTEEATNGEFWAPDTRTMSVISRAAFEVDDYWRIVDILHNRLTKFDRKTWRVSYKTLLLLDHLLTHGPLRVADEFQDDKEVIEKMGNFQFVDEKGFNWGLSVRNLSARIVNLLENELFLKEERARTRKLTRGIQGFGSFTSRRSPSHDGSFKGLNFRPCRRCNSDNSAQINQEYEFLAPDDNLLTDKRIHKAEKIYEDVSSGLENSGEIREDEYPVEDHPFCYSDHHTSESLLSTLE